jgi:Protein of unknown function (DUF3604)
VEDYLQAIEVEPQKEFLVMRIDGTGSDNGSVAIETPTRHIPVGSRYHMQIIYTAGPQGVATGGSLRFKLPGLLCRSEDGRFVLTSNPGTRLTVANHVPAISGKAGREFSVDDYLFVTIAGQRLAQGDTVTVSYGGNLTLWHMAAPECAMKWRVEVATDLDGTRSARGSGFALIPNCPVIEFVPEAATHYEVHQPSNLAARVPFRVVIQARDRYHNIATDHVRTVRILDETAGSRTFLGDFAFCTDDGGVLGIEELHYTGIGVHRLVVEDVALGYTAHSNPALVSEGVPARTVFWGDTHCHSRFSADTSAVNDQIATPEEDYRYARDTSALDFCMVTDHVEDLTRDEWQTTRETAAQFNEPGHFVAFSAFEATFRPSRQNGDKNVYFLQDGEDFIQSGTTEDLYENLKGRETPVIVIPHLHVPTNWKLHNPALERVVEIISHWGCGLSPGSRPQMIPGWERPAGSYVNHVLEQGAKLGFIGSADHSWGHPGDDFWWRISNINGGLAAVYAPTLTREDIWNGLWNRCCYATTRARILLDFDISGHAMGEDFTSEELPRHLNIRVNGTAAIESVEIIKNAQLYQTTLGNGKLDLAISLTDNVAERPCDYYYVHVTQVDSEQAWSSPVWVNHSGSADLA